MPSRPLRLSTPRWARNGLLGEPEYLAPKISPASESSTFVRQDTNQEFHLARAREEEVRAKQATHPAAKAAHARLARFHACIARRPDFILLEKASRAGQPPSYWASLDMRSESTASANTIGADQAQSGRDEPVTLTRPRRRRRDARHAVETILDSTYTPPPAESAWTLRLADVSLGDEAAGNQ
jgi:hypothetical protein